MIYAFSWLHKLSRIKYCLKICKGEGVVFVVHRTKKLFLTFFFLSINLCFGYTLISILFFNLWGESIYCFIYNSLCIEEYLSIIIHGGFQNKGIIYLFQALTICCKRNKIKLYSTKFPLRRIKLLYYIKIQIQFSCNKLYYFFYNKIGSEFLFFSGVTLSASTRRWWSILGPTATELKLLKAVPTATLSIGDINSTSGGDALYQNSHISFLCTVTTCRHRAYNQRVGCLQWLGPRSFGSAKRSGPRE